MWLRVSSRWTTITIKPTITFKVSVARNLITRWAICTRRLRARKISRDSDCYLIFEPSRSHTESFLFKGPLSAFFLRKIPVSSTSISDNRCLGSWRVIYIERFYVSRYYFRERRLFAFISAPFWVIVLVRKDMKMPFTTYLTKGFTFIEQIRLREVLLSLYLPSYIFRCNLSKVSREVKSIASEHLWNREIREGTFQMKSLWYSIDFISSRV